MDNIFMRSIDRNLVNRLYADAFEAANAKWPQAYTAAYKSMCTLNGYAWRFVTRNSLTSISKFLVMIVALVDVLLLVVYFLPINTLEQRAKGLPFSAIAITLVMLIMRCRFYNDMRHDLLFAENRRQALERRWPGISELVNANILADDYDIPEDPYAVLDLENKSSSDETIEDEDFLSHDFTEDDCRNNHFEFDINDLDDEVQKAKDETESEDSEC